MGFMTKQNKTENKTKKSRALVEQSEARKNAAPAFIAPVLYYLLLKLF